MPVKAIQLPLVPVEAGVYDDRAAAFLGLLNAAIRDNAMSHDQLAQLTRRDPSQLSRMLGGKGAHPSPDVVMAIMDLDARGVLLAGLAAMHGLDVVERRVDPVEENKRLRSQLGALKDEIARVLGER